MDTGKEHEYYIVRDEIWARTGLKSQGGMLCIGCLEGRIGRKLSPTDFPDLPINLPFFAGQSNRLFERIYGYTPGNAVLHRVRTD